MVYLVLALTITLLHVIAIACYLDALYNRKTRLVYIVLTYIVLGYSLYEINCFYDGVYSEVLSKSSSSQHIYSSLSINIASNIAGLKMRAILLYTLVALTPLLVSIRLEIDKRFNPWKYRRSYSELGESFLGLATTYYFYGRYRRDLLVLLTTGCIAAISWFLAGMVVSSINSICGLARVSGLDISYCRGVSTTYAIVDTSWFLLTFVTVFVVFLMAKSMISILYRMHREEIEAEEESSV